MSLLREYIRELMALKESNVSVRGYMKPASSFFTLNEWEQAVNTFLQYQKQK